MRDERPNTSLVNVNTNSTVKSIVGSNAGANAGNKTHDYNSLSLGSRNGNINGTHDILESKDNYSNNNDSDANNNASGVIDKSRNNDSISSATFVARSGSVSVDQDRDENEKQGKNNKAETDKPGDKSNQNTTSRDEKLDKMSTQ